MMIFTPFVVRPLLFILLSSILVLTSACGESNNAPENRADDIPPAWTERTPPDDTSPQEESPPQTEAPGEGENPVEEETSPTYPESCDVQLEDCANPILIPITTQFTVFFPAQINGFDATEFKAIGQAPQIGVGPVVIANTSIEAKAQITITGHNLGASNLDVTIWYGPDRNEERQWVLPCEVVDPED